MASPGHRFRRDSVLLPFCVLLLTGVPFAQSPQNRFLAYSTYNPQPGTYSLAAVNPSGLLCVASNTELYQLQSNGSLVYDKTISAIGSLDLATDVVAIDAVGNCYISASGDSDTPMSVSKYDAQGNVVFTVNYTGSGSQTVGGVAIDGSGNIWIAGSTTSNDLKTVNPIQGVLKGSGDAFVAEFNSAGTLIFSTYFGGSESDAASALALDANGNMYFVGTTTSSDFPTLNPLEPTQTATSGDAFLTKIDSTGHLLYSTFLGQTVGSGPSGVAVDASLNMFVTGGQIIAKLNATGSAVVYAVNVGGNGSNSGPITVDSQGNAYASACIQEGLATPVCPFSAVNPIQSDFTSGNLVGLDPNGNVIFLTPLGLYEGNSGPVDFLYSIGVDTAGNLYTDAEATAIAVLSDPLTLPVPLLKAVNGTYPGGGSFVAKIALGQGASFSMPATVDFPATPVGIAQTPIPINIYNTGTTSIAISGIAISGDYSQTNTCPAALVAATTCSLTITFAPTAAGIRNGAVTITDDSPGSPHVIQLTGSAAEHVVTLVPTAIDFGPVVVGSTVMSGVTLTNSSTLSLQVSRISVSGDYSETNDCGSSVVAGASCDIGVTFTPTSTGMRTATLTITDNAANSPQTVALTGTGVNLSLSVSPASVTFASEQQVKTVSAPVDVTLQNKGGAVGYYWNMTGPFQESDACPPPPLQMGESCTLHVVFAPTVVGTSTGAVTFYATVGGGGSFNVPLTGTAYKSPNLALGVSPSSSSSATVAAGETASYTLAVGGQGLSGTATLSCKGSPKGATCTVPASVSMSATSASTFTVSVPTTSRDSALLLPQRSTPRWMWATGILGVLLMGVSRRKRSLAGTFGVLPFVLLIWVCACGGGGGSSVTPPTGNPNGTPVGTYTLTVTATTASATQSIPLTLKVQ